MDDRRFPRYIFFYYGEMAQEVIVAISAILHETGQTLGLIAMFTLWLIMGILLGMTIGADSLREMRTFGAGLFRRRRAEEARRRRRLIRHAGGDAADPDDEDVPPPPPPRSALRGAGDSAE